MSTVSRRCNTCVSKQDNLKDVVNVPNNDSVASE